MENIFECSARSHRWKLTQKVHVKFKRFRRSALVEATSSCGSLAIQFILICSRLKVSRADVLLPLLSPVKWNWVGEMLKLPRVSKSRKFRSILLFCIDSPCLDLESKLNFCDILTVHERKKNEKKTKSWNIFFLFRHHQLVEFRLVRLHIFLIKTGFLSSDLWFLSP